MTGSGDEMRSQAEKGRLFRDMHARPGILILPNPWDAGTAKLLASLGFEALATTSLGRANALGGAAARFPARGALNAISGWPWRIWVFRVYLAGGAASVSDRACWRDGD